MEDLVKLAGYQPGMVAETILSETYPELTDREIKAITVILMLHLITEQHINTLLSRCLGAVDGALLDNKLSKMVKKKGTIEGCFYWSKVELMIKIGCQIGADYSKQIEDDFRVINSIRNAIAHRLGIKAVQIGGYHLNTEQGLIKLRDFSLNLTQHIHRLNELIESYLQGQLCVRP